MAWNHRGEYIADPHLTQRLRAIQRMAYGVNIASGARSAAQEIRDTMGMGGSAPLDEREDADDVLGYSDRDLMPDTNAPVNPAVQTFQESGHGFSVRKEKEGQ
jgi:hypothetical protein